MFQWCNFAIIFHWLKLVFTDVIFLHFSREEVIFHGWFQGFFHELYQIFTGGKQIFYMGRHIFLHGDKKITLGSIQCKGA